ncbi:MAG: MotA/TolQ/ExbB proton channel family protein [Pseudomonadota bacterium]
MDLAIVFRQGDAVLIGVFTALVVMSVLTWYLVIAKSLSHYQQRRANRRFIERFWQEGSDNAAWQAAQHSPEAPLAQLADTAFTAVEQFRRHPRLGDLDKHLVRTLRNGINRESARSASGMTLLASIGSTAPFIGLFGTVWGIYHALITIAESGNASMEMVAGPLGEALVATAAGLAAAIPAVLAYNAFQRAARTLREELDGFAHDLHALLLHQAEAD